MLNQYIKNSLYAAALLGFATACEPEIDRETPDYEQARGEADFSVYVALGNSLTAGVSDGALNRAGQENSYPAIIAEKMEFITPDFEFDQPLLPEGRINGTLILQEIIPGPPLTPVIVQESNGLSPVVIAQPVSGSFNNMGVPGARVGHLTMPGYGSAQGNILFARFASAPTATVVEDAVAQDPTFFTLWIGNNDVLGYATNGGEDSITAPSDFEAGYRAIISQLVASNANIEGALANIPSVSNIPYLRAVSWNRFGLDANQAAQINSAVEAKIEPAVRQQVILGASAQVVATERIFTQKFVEEKQKGSDDATAQQVAGAYIQSDEGQAAIGALVVEFKTKGSDSAIYSDVIDRYSLALAAEADEDEETTLASVFGRMLGPEFGNTVSTGVDQRQESTLADFKAAGYYPTFTEGPNGFVVDEPNSPTKIRQLNENDLVTLRVGSAPASEFNPLAGDITIPGKYVLDVQEQEEVRMAIAAYNEIIAEVASENTFALVDMHGFFNQVVDGGITEGGTRFTNAFITGNAFSLDGVHLTQKGYALVARRFIETINSYYKSDLPLPNVRNYPAVGLP